MSSLGRLLPAVFLPFFLQASTPQNQAREAFLSLAARDYGAAIRALEAEYGSQPKDALGGGEAERMLFLLANARLVSGDAAGAARDFEACLDRHAEGRHAVLARFGLARAKAKVGDHRTAADHYAHEVARLLSVERRLGLAATYTGLVDKRLAQEPPDTRAAIAFLDLAVALELPRDKEIELRRQAAELAYRSEDWADAARRAEEITKLVGPTVRDPAATRDRISLARAWRRAGKVVEARRLLEDLLRGELAAQGVDAAAREVAALARFELAATWGLPTGGTNGLRARDELSRLLSEHPDAPFAAEATWLLVKTLEALGRSQEALDVCGTLLARYKAVEAAPSVLTKTVIDPLAEAAIEKAILLGALGRFEEALQAARDYLAGHPAHGRWVEAQQAILDFELRRASALADQGPEHAIEAIELYHAWLASHPLDARAASVSLSVGKLFEAKAKSESVEETKRRGFAAARESYEQTAAKYPNSGEASEARFSIGRLYETELFDYAAAIAAYGRVSGGWQAKAQLRLTALREKSLVVTTERIFRSDEAAVLKVATRNIDKLRVRVYGLDYETFFRGTRGVGDVAALAVEVIAPDQSFEAPTPDYEPYRETERALPIETKGPGAWIVKVDDGALEATAVVFVSDLAVITKAARDELFIFAQNTKTQAVEAGAEVVVTDGSKVVAEGRTDERGVWRYRGEATKAAKLCVFATTASGSGATTMDLSGLVTAQGLVARAAIWTDRTLFAPGEVLHAKAVLREVEAGQYRLPPRVPHRFEVLDPSGRLLGSVSQEPDEFGTLRADFDLPETSPPGSYSLVVTRERDQRVLATETVAVEHFTKPRASLEIESKATTLLRGDKIEGVVRAAWFFGGPVVGRRISVRANIDGGRVLEGRSDENGSFAFSFETQSLASEASVLVTATLAEESAVVQRSFEVRSQAFTLALDLPSKLFICGDSLEAQAMVRAHDGALLARELRFALFELETTKRGTVERPRGEVIATSLAATGMARATFQLSGDSKNRSGNWRLRVVGVDRNGASVEASTTFFVSGEDDATKLRVLCDTQHGSVGSSTKLRIVNRDAARLALITIEGDAVLDFETRPLALGETIIDLPFREVHAPNFAWNIALAGERRLYTARKDFIVARPLDVELRRIGDARLRPGDEVPIEVIAKDGAGRPVRADFSLALVDQALLDLRPDASATLDAIFWGPSVRRNTELVTHGSTAFSYAATTRGVNSDLKADELLRERLRAEELMKEAWRDRGDAALPGLGDKKLDQFSRGALEPSAVQLELEQTDVAQTMGIGGGGGGKFGVRSGGIAAVRRDQRLGQQQLGVVDLNSFGGGQLFFAAQGQQEEAGIVRYFKSIEGRTALTLSNDFATRAAREELNVQERRMDAGSSIWVATLRTGDDGRATTTLRLPLREGAFRLRVRGLSAESLFGEASEGFEVSRDLLLEPVVPSLVLEGDVVHARLGVHWLGKEATRATWRVKSGADLLLEGSKEVAPSSEERSDFDIATKVVGVQPLAFEGETAAGSRDRVLGGYEVRAKGIEERDARAGLLGGETSFELALPKGEYRSRTLTLDFGPELPEELLPTAPLTRRYSLSCGIDWLVPTQQNRAAAGLTALALFDAWKRAATERRDANTGLAATIRTTIGQLTASLQDGRLAWIGKTKNDIVDVEADHVPAAFLLRAPKGGLRVDRNVLGALRARLMAEAGARDQGQATLALLVAAEDGSVDFARFNTVLRARTQMSLGSKARLVLAAAAMGRPGLTADLDLVSDLRRRFDAGTGAKPRHVRVDAATLRDSLWALLAVREEAGNASLVRLGMDWLWAQREANGFADAVATALATDIYARQAVDRDQLAAKVVVRVASFETTIDLAAAPRHHRVEVPAQLLTDDKVRVTLQTAGRGKVVYTALLAGMTRGLPEGRRDAAAPQRRYFQPVDFVDGRPLPEGFAAVDETVERWTNLASEVAIGESIQAQLRWHPSRDLRARFGSVVIEEPLPAGAYVRSEDVSGNFDEVEVGRGFLRFYLHATRPALFVQYALSGVVAGEYGVLPARVFSLDQRDMQAYGAAQSLRVLRVGEARRDVRRPTPDELLARGTRLFDDPQGDPARRAEAELVLTKLWDEYRDRLKDSAFGDVVRRLLQSALQTGEATKTIALFEALRDRDANAVLSFADTEKVAAAYAKSGEFERALQVREAVCETLFLREVQVAGALDRVGEVALSIDFMNALFHDYPGLPTMRGALYALAQSLHERAASIADDAPGSAALRISLRRSARDLCREYLWRYPDDADADEVVFALASVALDADQVEEAKTLLERALPAHTASKWLDDFLYLSGYASYLRREDQAALDLLARVASEDFVLGADQKGPSSNRDAAVFLQGQIHHAAGNPSEAVAKYEAVETSIVEAKEAADYFRARELRLPEVVVLAPTDATDVTLTHRNLEAVSIAVYKVDLMRLYLMRKSLDDVASVQLFGIAPVFEQELDLRADPRFRDVERALTLPLEGRGAWLILARTGAATSTSLVVRTALEVETQELVAEGRVRVNVRKDGVVVPRATVKVVGDRDGTIRSGRTDLRGVFVADAVQGIATVLVQEGEDYAFFRGKVALGPPMQQVEQQRGIQLGVLHKSLNLSEKGKNFDALEGNRVLNIQIQRAAREKLETYFENKQQGVDLRRAK